MICLRKNHRLRRILNLNGTSKQVEDKGQVDVLGVNKTCKLCYLSRYKVSVKLIALVPGIVKLITHCACNLQEWIRPGIPPDHSEIEIIETIEGVARFVPALRGERIIRKLKACVERVHVCVHS